MNVKERLLRLPKELRKKVIIFNRKKGEFGSGQDVIDNGTPSDDIEIITTIPIQISFRSSANKLRRGKNEQAELSWTIDNANKAYLYKNDIEIMECEARGTLLVSPDTTTKYSIKAYSDYEEIVKEQTVFVFDEAEIIDFSVDKKYILKGVPFTIRWSVKYATKVLFDGEEVNPVSSCFFKDGIDDEKEYILSVTDEFSTCTKSLKVRLLPLPLIRTIMAPTPNFENIISISSVMPIKYMDTQMVTLNETDVSIESIEKKIEKMPCVADIPLFVSPQFNIPHSTIERIEISLKSATTSINHMVKRAMDRIINKNDNK